MNYFMQEQFNFIFFAEPQDLIFKKYLLFYCFPQFSFYSF